MTEKGKLSKAVKNDGKKSAAQPKSDGRSAITGRSVKSKSTTTGQYRSVGPSSGTSAERNFDKAMPSSAADAVRKAYVKALNAGHPVLIIEGDKLIRVNADNSRTFIRNVEAPVQIPKGTTYKIK